MFHLVSIKYYLGNHSKISLTARKKNGIEGKYIKGEEDRGRKALCLKSSKGF